MFTINTHAFRFSRGSLMLLCLMLLLAMLPQEVWAAEGGLPFEEPLAKLKDSISGPVAFTFSLLGIIGAGAMLIFGGDLSGFMRTMVFVVLAGAVIVGATNIVEMFDASGATIATLEGAPSLHASVWKLA